MVCIRVYFVRIMFVLVYWSVLYVFASQYKPLTLTGFAPSVFSIRLYWHVLVRIRTYFARIQAKIQMYTYQYVLMLIFRV